MREEISSQETEIGSSPRDKNENDLNLGNSSNDVFNSKQEKNSNVVTNLVKENINISREPLQSPSKDDLIDIHVGNPLKKIEELLREIKRQKAFSFTLKGSLGIAGVAVTLSLFGFFGGGKMLCEKGTTTKIGYLKKLNYKEQESYNVPFVSDYLNKVFPKSPRNRIVMINNDFNVIGVSYAGNVSLKEYIGLKVIITGNYNSCRSSITISNPIQIEEYTH